MERWALNTVEDRVPFAVRALLLTTLQARQPASRGRGAREASTAVPAQRLPMQGRHAASLAPRAPAHLPPSRISHASCAPVEAPEGTSAMKVPCRESAPVGTGSSQGRAGAGWDAGPPAGGRAALPHHTACAAPRQCKPTRSTAYKHAALRRRACLVRLHLRLHGGVSARVKHLARLDADDGRRRLDLQLLRLHHSRRGGSRPRASRVGTGVGAQDARRHACD